MRDDEVARVSDFLELKSESGIRVGSSQRAAPTIDDWAVPTEFPSNKRVLALAYAPR